MTSPGLRERKRQRTRDALTDAAYALFERKGFDATTVDEIAGAVEVSPRTFFRYFTSKEDVALALADEQLTRMVQTLADWKPDDPVITALKGSVVDVVTACESDGAEVDRARYRRLQALLLESPALMAACRQRGNARLEEVARLVGLRMGVEPAADPRPYLIASIALCAVQTAADAWQQHRPGATGSELLAEMFDLLAADLNYPAHGRRRS